MMVSDVLRPTLLLVLAATFVACSRSEPAPEASGSGADGPAMQSAAATTAEPEPGPAPEETGKRPFRPERIYYDLTAYEWYAQGQPLMADGRGYMPSDVPLTLPDTPLEKAGEYQGVDYYVEEGAEPPYPVVYVPVFEGYWLPFAPVGARPDAGG